MSSQETVARTVLPEDLITVNITARWENKKTTNYAHYFNGQGQETDASGQVLASGATLNLSPSFGADMQLPPFPVAELKHAIRENDNDECNRLQRAYYASLAEFKRTGGVLISDTLIDAVYNFVASRHDITAADRKGLVLTKEQITCRAPVRVAADQPGVWSLLMTPTWGQ